MSNSRMTTRLETREVWRVSGGSSVCASTKATSTVAATATAISSRRRRLRSASRVESRALTSRGKTQRLSHATMRLSTMLITIEVVSGK